MPEQHTIHSVLKKYWGFDRFRPMQEEIIRAVLERNDTLALLPTGGGKSLCYQVPALMGKGLCIVVSPLIALMKDQSENLASKGIKSISVTSLMSRKETDIALDNCIYGDVRFLFLSPERLTTPLFRARLEKMKADLIAVDEAHCISQWGYDFRPAYLQIAEIRAFHPGVPVLALTASARPDVVEDIKTKLKFKAGHRLFRGSFYRENLAYCVADDENKNEGLLKRIRQSGGSSIVYARTRRRTQEITRFLNRNGIQSDFYHAGLKPAERAEKQNHWMKGKNPVMVATNAFGMGIDKPDVRLVAHMDIPDSLEAYFQEAGRAGRDGKKAESVLFIREQDRIELEELVKLNFPEIKEIRNVYQCLANFYQVAVGAGEGMRFDFEISLFSRHYNLEPKNVFSCLRILEKEGYLSLSDGFHQPSRVHVPVSSDELYRFRVENKPADEFITIFLRSYAGLFDAYVKINEEQIAKRWNRKKNDVVKMLNLLHSRNIISYLPETDQPQLVFLLPRADSRSLTVSKENLALLKKTAEDRMRSILRYSTVSHICRSRQLLLYFGENISQHCGICDVCKSENRHTLSVNEFEIISQEIHRLLEKKTFSIKELVYSLGKHEEIKILKSIQWLLDNEDIRYSQGNFLVLKKNNINPNK